METMIDVNILSTFGEETIKTLILVAGASWVLYKQRKEKQRLS